jgi:hypothetical protein
MRKAFAIICLILLFSQAIPVVHFFAEEDVIIALIDEDKPEEGKIKGKIPGKEFCTTFNIELLSFRIKAVTQAFLSSSLPTPYLEFFTPPPDVIA